MYIVYFGHVVGTLRVNIQNIKILINAFKDFWLDIYYYDIKIEIANFNNTILGRFVNRCRSPLDQSDDTNAITVLNYPVGDSAPYLPVLGLNDQDWSYSSNYRHLVITTVTSQKLFTETIKLVKHLRQNITPNINKTKLVIFETGLSTVAKAIVSSIF